MANIQLRNLNKTYGNGFSAVKDVNLDIADGEFLVLVGPSGCGKSTTLRMIAGLEQVSSGDIQIDGIRVNELEPGDRDIAMVFQNYALYPHMSVRKNMSFGLKMRKTPAAEIESRVAKAAEILSLEPLLERKPDQLSGGQQQRVAVGRAIVRQPKAFLFDEPLSNLDAKLRVQMRAELARLHQRLKTTTIFVTHDQVEAMTLGSRIAIMNEGTIQQFDTPMNAYQKPANLFVAGFIGSPAMNFVRGRVENGKFVTKDLSYDIGNQLKLDDSVTFGFRPESLSTDSSLPKLAEVELEVVEELGHESIVYFQLNGETMAARLHKQKNLTIGDSLEIHLPQNEIHLFDGGGERIELE